MSILFRLSGDADYGFSEVVGVVQRVGPDTAGRETVFIARRDATVVEVVAESIVSMKVVPTH